MGVEVGHAADPPAHILGYAIRSRTRIYVSYVLPSCLGLLLYLLQTSTDLALSYQHFRQLKPAYGAGTLILLLLPALFSFLLIMSSKQQRSHEGCALALMQLFCFPCLVVYRYSKRLFWAIEALFHTDSDKERMQCLAKATETSSIELYLLLQAYVQAAPQIILQMYYMLQQDIFRSYETTALQGMCLIWSAIDLATITTSYHRMESQRCVGRHYPWATPAQVQLQRNRLEQNERLCCEAKRRKRESERTIATSFPQSEQIMANFHARHVADEPRTHDMLVRGYDEVDNDALETLETQALMHRPRLATDNATDDDKLHIVKPKLRLQPQAMSKLDDIEVLDTVPETPAPPPPPSTAPAALPAHIKVVTPELRRTMSDNRHSRLVTRPLSQLETFKDMLLVNAQLYIKEHVPRPPKLLMTRVAENEQPTEERTPLISSTESPMTPQDVVDFYFPRATKLVNGIEQDDFAGRTVAFFGWISFIIMRMLSLAMFCVFYPRAFFIIVGVHYAIMLAALALETRCCCSWSNRLFYLLLAYIYIFVLLEFRVCFKRISVWYGWYLVLVLTENISMTSIWYANEQFGSWWFGFIWEWIVYSGVLFLATMVVYYCILRPRQVSLIVEDESTLPAPATEPGPAVA